MVGTLLGNGGGQTQTPMAAFLPVSLLSVSLAGWYAAASAHSHPPAMWQHILSETAVSSDDILFFMVEH